MPKLRAEQLKDNSLNDLQIALNAAIKQSKIAGQLDDPTGWISKGTVHTVDTEPTWDGSQKGQIYYNNTTDEVKIGISSTPFYAVVSGNGGQWESLVVVKVGSEGQNWDGQKSSVFSSGDAWDADGENLFVYLNGILLQKGPDYTITNTTTITLSDFIGDKDKITFLIYKNTTLNNYATKKYVEDRVANISADDLTNLATKEFVETRATNITASCVPDMTGASGSVSTINIGSAEKKFNNIWANDVHVGASSLYVNGKQVISDVSDTMTFTTEIDKAMNIKTTGTGSIAILSDNMINATSAGGLEWKVLPTNPSKNIIFTNQSSSGNITFTSANQIIFNATETVTANNLTVTGNFTVNGTTTTVNTEQVTIKDNLITLNSNQTGTPSTVLISGIDVERGDENNYRFIFEEATDTFKIGMVGQLQPVATRDDTPVANGVAYWDATNKKMTTSSNLTFDGTNLTVSSKRLVTVTSAAAFPTSPAPGLGDMCYRTDLDELYFYQGAVWIQI